MRFKNAITAAEARVQLSKATAMTRAVGKGLPADIGRANDNTIFGVKVRSVSTLGEAMEKPRDSRQRSVAGKRPDLADRYFRSKAEANYARYMNYCIERNIGDIVRWEYEVKEFEFPVKRGQRFYKPDFKVYKRDGTYQWHEVKGWMDAASKTKLKRFKQYHPEEEAKLEIIGMPEIAKIRSIFGSMIANWEGS